MSEHDPAITDFGYDADPDAVLEFLAQWVTGSRAAAEAHVADHADGRGTTLVARLDDAVAGLVTIRWTSNNPTFADHDIPLVHQLSVAPRFRRSGVASALMDAAEHCAARGGRQTMGITVGLFDQYGPAQRLYAERGYVPDGRGVCRGRTPLREGDTVQVDHSLILWLTKDITHLGEPQSPGRGRSPASTGTGQLES